MEIKLFEIRDRGTCITGLAIKFGIDESEVERKLLSHAGYGRTREDHSEFILLGNMDDESFSMAIDEHSHRNGARTMYVAHSHIRTNWDKLRSGDLIDVQFVLGETTAPKQTDLGPY